MSEIKPVAWLVEDCEDSCFATVNAQMVADFMADTDSVSTPLYTAKQLAEAVAAEREKNATYLNTFWAASSLDGEEVVVTIKLHAPFVMDEKVKDMIRRVLNESAAK